MPVSVEHRGAWHPGRGETKPLDPHPSGLGSAMCGYFHFWYVTRLLYTFICNLTWQVIPGKLYLLLQSPLNLDQLASTLDHYFLFEMHNSLFKFISNNLVIIRFKENGWKLLCDLNICEQVQTISFLSCSGNVSCCQCQSSIYQP